MCGLPRNFSYSTSSQHHNSVGEVHVKKNYKSTKFNCGTQWYWRCPLIQVTQVWKYNCGIQWNWRCPLIQVIPVEIKLCYPVVLEMLTNPGDTSGNNCGTQWYWRCSLTQVTPVEIQLWYPMELEMPTNPGDASRNTTVVPNGTGDAH